MKMILAAAVLAALALPRAHTTARNGISWTMAPTYACLSAPGAYRTRRNGRRVHTMAMPGGAVDCQVTAEAAGQRGAIVRDANG
jgi:hypothetical protein